MGEKCDGMNGRRVNGEGFFTWISFDSFDYEDVLR